MENKTDKLFKNASQTIFVILVCILVFTGCSFAAGSKSDIVGKPQRIQDAGKLQKVMHDLVQKAYAQHKQITQWHESARLESKKMQAKNYGQNNKALVATASKRACQIQLAMARTPEDITIPGCRVTGKTR